MPSIDKDEVVSRTFYIMRMFAIISVATAHCSSYVGYIPETLRAMIGTIGVPIFFISSGYYFTTVKSVKDFWDRRKKIIIPWIILGMMTYLIEAIRGGELSWLGLAQWILGYKTWLYYVPVLICFYAILQFFNSNKWLVMWIVVFLVFFSLSYTELITKDSGWITQYQIPFNNIGFFVCGIALKRNDIEKILKCNRGIKILTISIFIAISTLYLSSGIIGYWANIFSIPFELFATVVVMWMSWIMRNIKPFINIGKRTYFIYFIHMQIAMYIISKLLILTKLNSIIPEIALLFVKPILVVASSYLIWCMLNKIAKDLKLESNSWIIAV